MQDYLNYLAFEQIPEPPDSYLVNQAQREYVDGMPEGNCGAPPQNSIIEASRTFVQWRLSAQVLEPPEPITPLASTRMTLSIFYNTGKARQVNNAI